MHLAPLLYYQHLQLELQIVRAIDANIVLCFVDDATEQSIDSAKAIGNTMVLLNYTTITSDIMEYAKEQGVRVEAYTVDSYAARVGCWAWGTRIYNK